MKLRYKWLTGVVAIAAIATGGFAWFAHQPEIAAAPPGPHDFTTAQIARGEILVRTGDCAVCHTASGGARNAGGGRLDTPFGVIVSSNITPDRETGIGAWPYAAFERAMRRGVDREGHYLYPAFPYTSFARFNDEDMRALYAYLMTQPPVRSAPPPSDLKFPFNLRMLMAGWNMLFLDGRPWRPDPSQSAEWNRGAYLVQSAAHCTACHSPRNVFGAEQGGADMFAGGGVVDGWHVPALNTASRAPIAWNADDLYDYLRTGYSARHGVAAGPMAPVVEKLSRLPKEDVRAIAVYMASFAPAGAGSAADLAQHEAALDARSDGVMAARAQTGAALFAGACAGCHRVNDAPKLFGVRPGLAYNTNLYADSPDNLLRILLNGIGQPATRDLGYMPAFRYNFNDAQLAALANYLRTDIAGQPAWTDVAAAAANIRSTTVRSTTAP
ncbi:cytochrome c [Paraburkholderia tagetis]|uniref:Cytochrome c n=1 Tax=Paraburkholderia tagetis TaxID=2913261 RepID=A0A9X1RSY4_9BURK|nr:cytochrome c [Paraburkholderia tagetis]MCG5075462.1 cytochrome c [Paraburkholderia tagetis]